MPLTEPRTLRFLGLDLPVRAQRRPERRQGEPKWTRVLEPTHEFWVTLETDRFAADPLDALVAVRAGLGSPARLDDVPIVAMRLMSADRLSFPSRSHPELRGGRFTLELQIGQPSPFPYPVEVSPHDAMPFARALLAADDALGGADVHLERIRADDRSWFFPTAEIGCLGVVVDRRSPDRLAVLGTGLGGDLEAMLWAFGLGLLDGPCSLVVHHVTEPDLASRALAEVTSRSPEEVERTLSTLPATFRIREDAIGVCRLFEVREAMRFEVRPLEADHARPIADPPPSR